MNVVILDSETSKTVAVIPLNFQMIDSKTSEDDLINEAWRTALEDKSVIPSRRDMYKFVIEK